MCCLFYECFQLHLQLGFLWLVHVNFLPLTSIMQEEEKKKKHTKQPVHPKVFSWACWVKEGLVGIFATKARGRGSQFHSGMLRGMNKRVGCIWEAQPCSHSVSLEQSQRSQTASQPSSLDGSPWNAAHTVPAIDSDLATPPKAVFPLR